MSECFMPLHVEMNSNILTIAQTYVQNGDLMYDPRIDFKVDYENKRVIPESFENSGMGVYEQYDITDVKPETMKQINDILTFADDWMDRIEEQGYSASREEQSIEHNHIKIKIFSCSKTAVSLVDIAVFINFIGNYIWVYIIQSNLLPQKEVIALEDYLTIYTNRNLQVRRVLWMIVYVLCSQIHFESAELFYLTHFYHEKRLYK